MAVRPKASGQGTPIRATLSKDAGLRLAFAAASVGMNESKVLEALVLAHLPPLLGDGLGLSRRWHVPIPDHGQPQAASIDTPTQVIPKDKAGSLAKGSRPRDLKPPVSISATTQGPPPTTPTIKKGLPHPNPSKVWPPDRLLAALGKADLRQAELASMLGVVARTVGCWITRGKGVSKEYEDQVTQIFKELGV